MRRCCDCCRRDSNRSIAAIAEEAGLSVSACQRRIKALEAAGIITGYSARLDPEALGLEMHAIVEITLASQSRQVLEAFETAVLRFDEILECDLMAGRADYLLRVAAGDPRSFDDLHRNCLSQLPGVSSMRTYFAIWKVKAWRGYRVG
ncbi:Lrp/AsnC family transcriptional regulator [Sphingomonas sp. MMS24-JH45]